MHFTWGLSPSETENSFEWFDETNRRNIFGCSLSQRFCFFVSISFHLLFLRHSNCFSLNYFGKWRAQFSSMHLHMLYLIFLLLYLLIMSSMETYIEIFNDKYLPEPLQKRWKKKRKNLHQFHCCKIMVAVVAAAAFSFYIFR